MADAPQLSQVSQELSLSAVGANDSGDGLVDVLSALCNMGISIEPVDITSAFLHQYLTTDREDVSLDHITPPIVLSGGASSMISGDLSEISRVSSVLLDVSVESGDLSGLSDVLSDSYHAFGPGPGIFSPSRMLWDLLESDDVSDLSPLMSSDLEDFNTVLVSSEFLLAELDLSMPYSLECLKHPDLWIGDTGASMHTTRFKTNGFNFRAGASSVGATGAAVQAECCLDIRGQFVDRDGTLGLIATLKDVGYNTNHNFNLLSITCLWELGWSTQSGDSDGIVLLGPDRTSTIKFDIAVRTTRGAVHICRFVRLSRVGDGSEISGANPSPRLKKMSILSAHQMLGHKSEDATRRTAKALGITITRGSMPVCEACALSKAKQKNVPKKSTSEPSTRPFERVHTDISQIKVLDEDANEATLSKKSWVIFVDAATGKKLSLFVAKKGLFVESAVELLTMLSKRGAKVRVLRMDPSGENKKFVERVKQVDCAHLQPLDCELTPRDSPQFNSLAETAFPHLAACARAMMSDAGVPTESRKSIVIEALRHVTMLDGLVVVELGGVKATRDVHCYGSNPKWTLELRIFGEAAVVKEKKSDKSTDRGIKVMFVGYSTDRTSDCARFWNPAKNSIIETRDAIFLNQFYFGKAGQTPMLEFEPEDEIVDGGDILAKDEGSDSDDEPEPPTTKSVSFADALETTIELGSADEAPSSGTSGGAQSVPSSGTILRSGRISRQTEFYKPPGPKETNLAQQIMSRTGTSAAEANYLAHMLELDGTELAASSLVMEDTFSPEYLMALFNQMVAESDEPPELMNVGAGTGGGFTHTDELRTLNYKEAMRSPDRLEWEEAIRQEYLKFEKFGVFKVIPRDELPADKKPITVAWAIKLKSNGQRRARANARGFEQIDGQHYFSDSISSPVSNPVTVRTLFTLFAQNPDWDVRVIDVEGAFLQGKFQNGEEMYMEVPDGMERFYGLRKDVVLKMLVPIYGTKQAAECFYKELVKKSKQKGYERSNADFTLFYVWNEGRLLVFAVWVDDIIAFGAKADLDALEADITSAFEAKAEPEFNEYVGNKIDINRGDDGIATVKFTQPVLIQKLKENHTPIMNRVPMTPAVPGSNLCKGDGTDMLTADQATKYRSLTALIMFIMQWSRPDLYNAGRSLARYMHAPNESHWKALHYCLAYIMGTSNRGLVIRPARVWDGSKDFVFVIHGRSDSNYASDVDDRRSVTGCRTFLEGSPVCMRSATQRHVTLSVTEAEGAAGVTEAQDMLYVANVLESLGLKVQYPMVLELDNKGAVDLANSWSVGGRTRHVDVRMYFLRELKDQGKIVIRHISGEDNDADIFTKNTDRAVFNKHVVKYVGTDEYVQVDGEEGGRNS